MKVNVLFSFLSVSVFANQFDCSSLNLVESLQEYFKESQDRSISLDCLTHAARQNNFEALGIMLDKYFINKDSELAETTLRNVLD